MPASACPSETEEATSERDDLNDDVEDVEDMDQEEDVNVVDVISGLDTKSIFFCWRSFDLLEAVPRESRVFINTGAPQKNLAKKLLALWETEVLGTTTDARQDHFPKHISLGLSPIIPH